MFGEFSNPVGPNKKVAKNRETVRISEASEELSSRSNLIHRTKTLSSFIVDANIESLFRCIFAVTLVDRTGFRREIRFIVLKVFGRRWLAFPHRCTPSIWRKRSATNVIRQSRIEAPKEVHQDRTNTSRVPWRVAFHPMSLRLRVLILAAVMVVGAISGGSAASAQSGDHFRTTTACSMAHCDSPTPNACRADCPHSPQITTSALGVAWVAFCLRDSELVATTVTARLFDFSERFDRPPR